MLTKIIISITPIIAYCIILLWTNQLINSKIKNKGDRKKYKKIFNGRIGAFFAPFFLCSVLLGTILFPKPDTWVIFGIIIFILKVITMLLQGVISALIFRRIKSDIHTLRHKSVEDILLEIEKD